jgi:hypothetical protein
VSTELERDAERAAHERDRAISDAERRERGIVHTPVALARFTARTADDALRTIGRRGIADPDVAILDPSCGPGVFLAAARAVAPSGAPRIAIGLDIDAHAIEGARERLAPSGWPLRFAAVDTLASIDPWLESERRGSTILILGNPPWAGRSQNRGSALIDGLLDDFRRERDGAPMRERKIGVLSDDYVRFWRWACEIARRSDAGAVVALVTNASFLDGPVHRGMRAALARYFARIDVVYFGGSALVARAKSRDDNLFGVRPAAALTIAVRPRDHREESRARVRVAAMRGAREEKLARLEGDLEALAPREIEPEGLWTLTEAVPAQYARWPSLIELMPFHREGVQTNRDAFCIDADRGRLIERLRAFARGGEGPWPARADVPSGHYDPDRARGSIARALEIDPDLSDVVVPIAYRPLDVRWAALVPALCHRPRPDLRAAVARSEFSLLTVRKDRGERAWSHFGAARAIADNCFLSARSSCRTRAFPTHLPDGSENVGVRTLARFAHALDAPPSAAELARYALCVLASPRYRARFDSALRADYPRIPPPRSQRDFDACRDAGRAIERAFGGAPSDADAFSIGHHAVASSELARAIATAAAAPLAIDG